MDETIKKREKPQHPSKMAEPIPPADFAGGRDEERQDQKNQRQHPRRSQRTLDRIRAQMMPVSIPTQKCEGDNTVNQQNEFGELGVFHGGGPLSVVSCQLLQG